LCVESVVKYTVDNQDQVTTCKPLEYYTTEFNSN